MLTYLTEHPEKGLLGYETAGFTVIQYWRSFEHLEAFAKDNDDPHLEAWRNYWKRVGKTTRTGIWHETFLVRAGEYEAIYGNMPPTGLGKAGEARAAGGRFRRQATAAPPDRLTAVAGQRFGGKKPDTTVGLAAPEFQADGPQRQR